MTRAGGARSGPRPRPTAPGAHPAPHPAIERTAPSLRALGRARLVSATTCDIVVAALAVTLALAAGPDVPIWASALTTLAAVARLGLLARERRAPSRAAATPDGPRPTAR